VSEQLPRSFRREILDEPTDLRAAWEANASDWIAAARAPNHDSYWLYHREQFRWARQDASLATSRTIRS
jgi:nitrate reductase alpha subunit